MIILEGAMLLLLSYLFISACLTKIRDIDYFRESLSNYQLLPQSSVKAASLMLIVFEAILAVGLFIPALADATLLAMAGLLLAYAGAIAINLLRGRRSLDCGCMGPGQRKTITWKLVWRNIFLVCVVSTLLVMGANLPADIMTWLLSVLVSCFVIVGYQAITTLVQNQQILKQRFDL